MPLDTLKPVTAYTTAAYTRVSPPKANATRFGSAEQPKAPDNPEPAQDKSLSEIAQDYLQQAKEHLLELWDKHFKDLWTKFSQAIQKALKSFMDDLLGKSDAPAEAKPEAAPGSVAETSPQSDAASVAEAKPESTPAPGAKAKQRNKTAKPQPAPVPSNETIPLVVPEPDKKDSDDDSVVATQPEGTSRVEDLFPDTPGLQDSFDIDG